MWNSGYWQCPYKSHPSHCMDSDTDDVGFLEALTKALQAKLPSKPNDVSHSSCCSFAPAWFSAGSECVSSGQACLRAAQYPCAALLALCGGLQDWQLLPQMHQPSHAVVETPHSCSMLHAFA